MNVSTTAPLVLSTATPMAPLSVCVLASLIVLTVESAAVSSGTLMSASMIVLALPLWSCRRTPPLAARNVSIMLTGSMLRKLAKFDRNWFCSVGPKLLTSPETVNCT